MGCSRPLRYTASSPRARHPGGDPNAYCPYRPLVLCRRRHRAASGPGSSSGPRARVSADPGRPDEDRAARRKEPRRTAGLSGWVCGRLVGVGVASGRALPSQRALDPVAEGRARRHALGERPDVFRPRSRRRCFRLSAKGQRPRRPSCGHQHHGRAAPVDGHVGTAVRRRLSDRTRRHLASPVGRRRVLSVRLDWKGGVAPGLLPHAETDRSSHGGTGRRSRSGRHRSSHLLLPRGHEGIWGHRLQLPDRRAGQRLQGSVFGSAGHAPPGHVDRHEWRQRRRDRRAHPGLQLRDGGDRDPRHLHLGSRPRSCAVVAR